MWIANSGGSDGVIHFQNPHLQTRIILVSGNEDNPRFKRGESSRPMRIFLGMILLVFPSGTSVFLSPSLQDHSNGKKRRSNTNIILFLASEFKISPRIRSEVLCQFAFGYGEVCMPTGSKNDNQRSLRVRKENFLCIR